MHVDCERELLESCLYYIILHLTFYWYIEVNDHTSQLASLPRILSGEFSLGEGHVTSYTVRHVYVKRKRNQL